MSKIRSQKANTRPRTRHLALATALVSISLSANASLLANGGSRLATFQPGILWPLRASWDPSAPGSSPNRRQSGHAHHAVRKRRSNGRVGGTTRRNDQKLDAFRRLGWLHFRWMRTDRWLRDDSGVFGIGISIDKLLIGDSSPEGPMGHLYDVPFVAVIGPGSNCGVAASSVRFSAAPESLAPASSADAYYPLVKSEVQTFTYRLPSAGEYTIGIGILSNWDTNNTSAILVDNVHASIPEPETLPLLGLGLAAFLSIRSLPCAGSRGSLKADKPGNVSEGATPRRTRKHLGRSANRNTRARRPCSSSPKREANHANRKPCQQGMPMRRKATDRAF